MDEERPRLTFSKEESLEARSRWGANDGPHAIASTCRVSLKEMEELLRPYPGWMGTPQIEQAVIRLGRRYVRSGNLYTKTVQSGLNRIQFHGPWLKPNGNKSEAYRHGHWVGCRRGHVYDTLFGDWAGEWIPIGRWRQMMEEFAQKKYGGWHITHWYRILKSTDREN